MIKLQNSNLFKENTFLQINTTNTKTKSEITVGFVIAQVLMKEKVIKMC